MLVKILAKVSVKMLVKMLVKIWIYRNKFWILVIVRLCRIIAILRLLNLVPKVKKK